EHPIERERVEVAPAHLDDGAEATVEGAAPRGLDDVDLASHHRVAPEHPRVPVREPDLAALQARDRPVRVVGDVVAAPEREAGDPLDAAAGLDGPAELAEGQLPLAAHDEVRRAGRRIGV